MQTRLWGQRVLITCCRSLLRFRDYVEGPSTETLHRVITWGILFGTFLLIGVMTWQGFLWTQQIPVLRRCVAGVGVLCFYLAYASLLCGSLLLDEAVKNLRRWLQKQEG